MEESKFDNVLDELQSVYDTGGYRSLFNFYIRPLPDVDFCQVFLNLVEKITTERRWERFLDTFDPVVKTYFREHVSSIIYCMPEKTQIFKNPNSPIISKVHVTGLIDGKIEYICSDTSPASPLAVEFRSDSLEEHHEHYINWILYNKNPIKGYLKNINKKEKNNYTELQKVIYHNPFYQPFGGTLSNDLQTKTIIPLTKYPWIKKHKMFLTIKLEKDKIISGGRTGLTQSIDITLKNKTCLIFFRNGSIHVLTSKNETEIGFVDFLFTILDILKFISALLDTIPLGPRVTRDLAMFKTWASTATPTTIVEVFRQNIYPCNTLYIGMLNIVKNISFLNKASIEYFYKHNDLKKICIYKSNQVTFTALSKKSEITYHLKKFEELFKIANTTKKVPPKTNPLFAVSLSEL